MHYVLNYIVGSAPVKVKNWGHVTGKDVISFEPFELWICEPHDEVPNIWNKRSGSEPNHVKDNLIDAWEIMSPLNIDGCETIVRFYVYQLLFSLATEPITSNLI